MSDATSFGLTPVSTLIAAPVAKVGPDATLFDVVDALRAASVGALVMSDGAGAVGIVSERDVVRALAERRDPATTRARDVATTTLVWCDAEATIADVAEEMMECYVRHVLVEDGGRLVGVVSARDLLGAYASADMSVE
jgi:CBS domain-containing protein